MTTCMITGIGGSIGVHVFCHVMHNTEWDVVGIDSFRHKGLTDRITEVLKDHPDWAKRLRIFTHDLTAPISWKMHEDMGQIDYILNVASLSDVHASIERPGPFIRNNVALIVTMLDYARMAKPKAFLQVSTDEVYGPTDGVSFHKEWDPIVPSNPYSASKAAQEAVAISYWRTYGISLIIVNLMNNFGEMQSSAKFPAIIQRKVMRHEVVTVHGDPSNIGSRYYIHSRNSADAFLFLLKHTQPHLHAEGAVDKPDRYNIVGHSQLTNVQLANMIARHLGMELQIKYEPFTVTRPGHDAHYGLDGSKLKALGWKAPVSLAESMYETVQWQREHPEWLETKSK